MSSGLKTFIGTNMGVMLVEYIESLRKMNERDVFKGVGEELFMRYIIDNKTYRLIGGKFD